MGLIDKSIVVEEIERKRNYEVQWMKRQGYTDYHMGLRDGYDDILYFLNNLEVKEVDFERELSKYVSQGIHRFFPNEGNDYYNIDSVEWQDYVIDTAKHFFDLGLKAQKGE